MTEKKKEKEKITPSDKSERDFPLAVKIAKAANDMGPIAKDGNNEKQDFQFISESAIKAGVRKVCAKYGFTIFPKRIKEITRYERRTARGGTLYFYDVMQEFEVTDGKETITGEMMGTGSDTGDKAYNKAVTVALKNFEKQLFNVSDQSDDPDSITPPETTGTVSNNQQPYQGQYNNYQNYRPTPVSSKPRKLNKAQLENYTVEFSDGKKYTLKAIFERAKTNDVIKQWIKAGNYDNTTKFYIKQLGGIYKAEQKIKDKSNQQPVSEDDGFEDIIAK